MGDVSEFDESFLIHAEALTNLCRVCGCVITGYRRDVALCIEELEGAFDKVNFKNDIENIHPKHICRTCYSALLNVKKNSIITSINVTKWKPHINDGSCETCKLSVKKAGRPKKQKSSGRRKNVTSLTDIMELNSSSHIPPDVEKAMTHILNIKMQQSCDKSVQLKSNRGPPVTVRALTATRKDSTVVSK